MKTTGNKYPPHRHECPKCDRIWPCRNNCHVADGCTPKMVCNGCDGHLRPDATVLLPQRETKPVEKRGGIPL